MRINKATDITSTDWFKFYPSGDLTPDQIAKLAKFERVEYIFEDFSSQSGNDFFREAVQLLLPSSDVYLVFAEPQPQRKSAVRSHKKMFYDMRDAIRKEDRIETEVETGDGYSVLAGTIRLTPDTVEFWSQNIFLSILQFVYVVKRSPSNEQINWEALLRQIVDERMVSSKIRFPHIPKILANFAGTDRSLITLSSTGRDEEIIEFFVSDKKIKLMLSELETRYRSQVEN